MTETRTIRSASVSAYARIQLAEVLTADVAAALQPLQTASGLAFPQEAHILIADR